METVKFIRPAQLAEMLGVSTVKLWKWRRDKILPEPISLGLLFIGWQAGTIEKWLTDQNRQKLFSRIKTRK